MQTSLADLTDDLLLECLAHVARSSLRSLSMVSQKWRALMRSPAFWDARARLGMFEEHIMLVGRPSSFPATAAAAAPVAPAAASRGATAALPLASPSAEGVSIRTHLPVTDEWRTASLQPNAGLHEGANIACDPASQKVYIVGGYTGSTAAEPSAPYETWIYDAHTGRLSKGVPLDGPRSHFVMGVIDGKLFVAGGRCQDSTGRLRDIKSAAVYDPSLDQWQSLPDMVWAMACCMGGVVGDKLYVIGRIQSVWLPRRDRMSQFGVSHMEVFDPQTNTWYLRGPIPPSLIEFPVTCVVLKGCLYLLHDQEHAVAWVKYDPRTDDWTPMHKLPMAPAHLYGYDGRLAFAITTFRERIYIIQVQSSAGDQLRYSGGVNGRTKPRQGGLVLVYDPSVEGSAAWTRVPDLSWVTNGALCTTFSC
eukprot:SM000016S01930  [mRNA]  locus=s16:630363:633328:- [translate_table: standard]